MPGYQETSLLLPPIKRHIPLTSTSRVESTHRRTLSVKGLPSLIFVRELPVPPLREWSPTHRRSSSVKGLPSLIFVRELPVPPLREWSPTHRRSSSVKGLPSSSSLESSPSLLFVNGALPLVGLR
ncbi:Hypothetical protein FKW44_005807 [Caligus rogercresseyi]|uniref:Uncharacterized protein n=1 Tax=Caligus rogercresseyi TaxID=217165 RepID=A0A7T8KCI0_CALRO|nr:Hypothetical protein FKW44_005807 [Caligus rogercresseyi]